MIRTLVSGNIGGTAPEERLAIALRSLVEQSGFSFLLVFPNGTESQSLFAGGDFSQMSEALRQRLARMESPGVRLVASLLRAEESTTGRILGGYLIAHRERYLDLARELERAGCLCPLPITLDGRRINGLLDNPAHGYTTSRRPLILSGVHLPDSNPLPVPAGLEEKIMSLRTHRRRASRTYGGRQGFSAWYLLSVGQPEHALRRRKVPYHWLQDGVIVESKQIDLGYGTENCELELFLDARELKTDLTGLRLVESEEKTARLQRTFHEVTRQLETLCRDKENLTREDLDEGSPADQESDHLIRRKEIAQGYVLTVPTLAASAVFPVVGGLATLGVGALVYLSQLTAKEPTLDGYYSSVTASLPNDAAYLRREAMKWGLE